MGVLIFGLVLACYWPALQGGLVWDDAAHVTRPDLRSWSGLGRIWFEVGATQQYYPVLHSAFWIEHRLWGDATVGYHLINVILHTACCCLFALVLRRLWYADSSAAGVAKGAEWLAAAIFAAHPVCVESVAWISEQKNTLSLLFYLLSSLAYLEFDARRKLHVYWLALVLFLLALATKSVTATLPAALLVVLWWKRGRLSWRLDVRPLVPWFLVAVAAGLFTAWAERKLIGAEGASFDLSAGQRLLLAGRVTWFYLGKLIWPAHLMFVYPRWQVSAAGAGWLAGLGGALAVTAAFWFVRGRCRGPLAGWLFFVGSLFPALGFFNVYPFLFSYVADHFQYLAGLGVIATVVAGSTAILARATAPVRGGGWIMGGLLLAGLALLSNRQSRAYRDSESLYRATLALNPACWMACNNLAVELARSPAGVQEALTNYEQALRLNPAYAEAHNNYANLLATLPGREPEALAHYEQALRLRPAFADAHANFANALVKLPGRMPEALAHYEEALRLAPGSAEVHYSLANALARIPGRTSEALAEYDRALRLKPNLAQAHVNLANELAKLPGRMPEALAHYAQALRVDPGLATTHYDLAVQLSELPGREADALRHFEEALRLKPDYAKAHNNLAILYARQGRLEEAKKHWETALQLDPNYDDARRNLDLLRKRQRP
jgi:tetratricopeptide (TPR) repeat protein